MFKVDFKRLAESEGYQRLKKTAICDCVEGRGCFNTMGCNKQPIGYEKGDCFHRYCDKFKWVIDRAKHYAYVTGLDIVEILDTWEKARTYSWLNYYQECNQPKLNKHKRVLIYDTLEDALEEFGKDGFRCPACNGVTTNPYTCNSDVELENGKICDWKVYGLFGDLGRGVYLFIKSKARGERIFTPIALEGSIS